MSPTVKLSKPIRKVSDNDAAIAVLKSPRRFAIQPHRTPEPGNSEILIKLGGCGVCGSNIPVWEGRQWFEYPQEPGAPGHEGWGIVEAYGADVKGIEIGQAVACLTYNAFATHDIADACNVVSLPKSLANSLFPAEPLACAINVLKRCRFKNSDQVAVIGVGFLGSLLTQLLTSHGIEVTAISRRPFALDVAEKCGAKTTVSLSDGVSLEKRLDQFPCVIEATGLQNTLDVATNLVSYNGQIVLAGYHQDGARTLNLQRWNWKGIDVTNAHQRDPSDYIAGMRDAVKEVQNHKIQLEPLITHHFSLHQIDLAFEMAASRPSNFLKAVVVNQS